MSTTSTSSGWNRSTSTPKPAPKKPSALRGVVAGLVVVALAAACVVVFMGKGEKPVEKVEKELGRIKEVTPAPAPKAAVETPAKKEVATKAVAKPETNGVRYAEAKARKQIHGSRERYEESIARGEKPRFSHTSENFLAMYAIPGIPVPPTPVTKMMEQDFVTALLDKIEILDTDTEEDIQYKEIVAGMKEEARDWIKAGGTLQGYFDELNKRQQKEANYRSEAQGMVMKTLREGNEEEAYALWKEFNTHLKKKGIAELHIHPKLFQYRDNDPDFNPQGGVQK